MKSHSSLHTLTAFCAAFAVISLPLATRAADDRFPEAQEAALADKPKQNTPVRAPTPYVAPVPDKTKSDEKREQKERKEEAKDPTVDSATRIEYALADIVKDEDGIFRSMENGTISQEEFERRCVELSYSYDELIHRDPDKIETLISYGKFLYRIGKSDQAFVMFMRVDQIQPDIAVVKQYLGNYCAEQGNYPLALGYYMKAVSLAPKEAVYHYGLGELLATFRDKYVADKAFTEDGIDQQTLAAFAKAEELAPKEKSFAFRHAEAYYDVKKPDWAEALVLWTKIHERRDLNPYERDSSRLHMARINMELGHDKEAVVLLREEVTPVLQATRSRLLKRLNSRTTLAEDKANGAVMAPADMGDADRPAAGAKAQPAPKPDVAR